MSTCHAWRQVALATTGLWNNIFLNGNHLNEAIELYGQRAGNRPLGVFLDSQEFCDIPTHSAIWPLLPRCRLLSMRVTVTRPLASAGPLPDLHTLGIIVNSGLGLPRTLLALPHLPALRALSVSRDSYTVLPLEIQTSVPLGVTTLRLTGYLDAACASKLVEACTHLEVLHWKCTSARDGSRFRRPLLPLKLTGPLHSLSHFSFDVDGYTSIKSVLDSLQAPELVDLQLVDIQDDFQEALEWQQGLDTGTHPFVNVKRFPKLRRLDLQVLCWHHDSDADRDEPDLTSILNLCLGPFIAAHADLEEIRLGEFGPDRTLVDTLKRLPKLSSVWWRDRHLEDEDRDATFSLITDLLQVHANSPFPCVVRISDPAHNNHWNPYHATTYTLNDDGELLIRDYAGLRMGYYRPADPLWSSFWDPI